MGRRSGKRVGPNHGWSSTRILALFCFLLSLLIRTTLLLPYIFHFIFKIFLAIMTIAGYIIHYFEQDLPIELLNWTGHIFIPIINTLLLHCHSFFYRILLIPVYFWNLFWHPMVNQSLIWFKIQMEMDNWSFTINKNIAIDGENVHNQFHDEYGDKNCIG